MRPDKMGGNPREAIMDRSALSSVLLVECLSTTLEFGDATFDVAGAGGEITIARDAQNKVVIRQKSGLYGSESSIEGGVVLAEEKTGDAGYEEYFSVHWDETSLPELKLGATPVMVERRYEKGQSIEFGLEDVSEYRVIYRDGVEAGFQRRDAGGFDFSFSTGFEGSFWKEPDESYTLKFKGELLEPTEEAERSRSKFVVSRSKYSGNLILILEDAATVSLL
jgi:hypothetical protein